MPKKELLQNAVISCPEIYSPPKNGHKRIFFSVADILSLFSFFIEDISSLCDIRISFSDPIILPFLKKTIPYIAGPTVNMIVRLLPSLLSAVSLP